MWALDLQSPDREYVVVSGTGVRGQLCRSNTDASFLHTSSLSLGVDAAGRILLVSIFKRLLLTVPPSPSTRAPSKLYTRAKILKP